MLCHCIVHHKIIQTLQSKLDLSQLISYQLMEWWEEEGVWRPLCCWCSCGGEGRTLDRSKHLHWGERQGCQERLARVGIYQCAYSCLWYTMLLGADDIQSDQVGNRWCNIQSDQVRNNLRGEGESSFAGLQLAPRLGDRQTPTCGGYNDILWHLLFLADTDFFWQI